MKKLFKISFLLAVLCFAVPVYADGDMSTGGKTCTQNCGGLYDGTNPNPTDSDTDSDLKPDTDEQDKTTIEEIYLWICKQISEIGG
jgi:hypothetical protein